MKNIIKAQLYQMKKERALCEIFLGFVIFISIMTWECLDYDKDFTGCALILDSASGFISCAITWVGIVIGKLCCQDFKDQTGNYELLSGHTRRQLYFGRAITSIFVAMISTIIMLAIPTVTCVCLRGWGNEVEKGEMVLRAFLMVFVFIRLMCLLVGLCFLLRSQLEVGMLGLLIGVGSEMLFQSNSHFDGPWLATSNLYRLVKFDIFYVYETQPFKIHMIYSAMLTGQEVATTLLASVIGSTLALYLGYVFFKKEDLK